MSIIFLLVGILLSIGLQFTESTNLHFTCSDHISQVSVTFSTIGVCYGVLGNNLPSKQEVVDLYKSKGIGKMRIYYPDQEVLQALRGSNIELILGVTKETLSSLTDAGEATNWVQKYVTPYAQDVKIKYITVGNEIKPNDNEAQYIATAMQNIQNAISSANLQGQIKVSTAIDMTLIGNSYPPNAGVFTDQANSYIQPIINFLVKNGAPLLANVYPYFAYIGNKQSISLDYVLFKQQGNNEVGYNNIFDAMLDSVYAALEKVGGSNVKIVVSESGWPSKGGDSASIDNAATYYSNLINHIKNGTPKRPGAAIETYLFAMFDENQKTGATTEQHYGLFNPDKSPKYHVAQSGIELDTTRNITVILNMK
ncbi:putative glucan endo-1,3-beta-D-glucosidase [Medicago truncatula]|nr:glucan endo-1,3-beta-glucosidase [Medicago truncatula]RHN61656.1 putative glucan endo-1,3-beta-D-glucosidase [Medicago truncatula]